MFEAARWRLAAWYAGVLVLMIAAFGGGLYAWTNRSLLAENDAQLAEAVRLMIPRLAGERRPLGGGGHRQGLERERGDGVRASEEDEQKAGAEAGEQAERLRGDLEEIEGRLIPDGDDWARLPVALAVLDARRRVVVRMPSPGPSWFPDPGLAETAQRLGTPAIATLRRGGVAVRVLAAPVPRPDGVWVVQAAKSIAETDAALRRLRQVLILGGLAALALGGVAGYLLAGRALAPIRDAFRRQREFVADASHELRTPLAVLRGSVEVLGRDLQAGRVPPDAAALVRDALTEADRLGRLVDDLLTLAQADAEGIALRFDAVDLAALVREACRGMDRLAEARDVALRVRAEAPVWVRGDPERLLQLVRILVDNAIRYNRPGGSVEVSVAPVDRSRSRQTELLVADTGPGMPPETLARAFDRFYRGDRARAQGEGGSGLGLAIARSIAAAHGGRVEIESQVGAGTRVRVLLPLAEASSF